MSHWRPSGSIDKRKKQSSIGTIELDPSSSHNTSAIHNPKRARLGATPPQSPSGVISHHSVPTLTDANPTNPVADAGSRSRKGKAVWSGIKSLLGTLESGAEAFGPLKSAISGLNRCVHIYEVSSKGRKGYEDLREKLEGLLDDLAEHAASPMGLVITNSVKRLCADIEVEIKNVEGKIGHNTGRRLTDAIEASDEIMECYRRVQGHLERLTLNANMSMITTLNEQTTETRLAKMCPTMSAIYNSAESDDIKRGGCTSGTRKPQIDFLLEWARNPAAGRTCWINGMAGTGKTTIAYTVSSRLDETFELGAASSVPGPYQNVNALVKILESDPDAHTRSLKIQYQKLLVEPLSHVRASLPADFIVLIDALDECDNENSLGQILDLVLSPAFALPLKFLVFSRPEPEIYQRMMRRVGGQDGGMLVLHDLDSDSVKLDIETYMKHELEHLPLTDAQWAGLIERCGVLFIYASTTCRYIKQAYNMETMDEAVSTIINLASPSAEQEDETVIDDLYLTILAAAFNQSGMSRANKSRMKDALETILCAIEPVTLNALAGLLGLGSVKQADALLRPLRSVLNVTGASGLVTTLHASFPEFMLSPNRSQAFRCLPEIRHSALAKTCLQLIDAVEPKFNICGLPSSYLFDDEIEHLSERVSRAVSPGLNYACRCWSTHLYRSKNRDQLVDIVRSFFLERLLLWMEILNLTKYMHIGTSIMRHVEDWSCEVNAPKDVVDLTHDAWQFVSVYANHPVSRSTPHIYVSILPFWPQSSPISKAYTPRTVRLLHPSGTALNRRQLAPVATWGTPGEPIAAGTLLAGGTQIFAPTMGTIKILDTSTGDTVTSDTIFSAAEDIGGTAIKSAVISPDGVYVVIGTNHHHIYLWDTRNEDDPKLLEQNFGSFSSIAFSPDGSCFVYGTDSKHLATYELKDKEHVMCSIMEYAGDVRSVAFSPSSLYIASGSTDWRVRIWAKNSRTVEKQLKRHTGTIHSVAFSPNGTLLASASEDQTVRVWDIHTEETILGPLKGHYDSVFSVAFAADGALIASGSIDGGILVYDAQSGQMIFGPLVGHNDVVHTVFFSPDNAWLFSCSWDGTLCKWNVHDPGVSANPPPMLPCQISAIRYSPDGLRVASGSTNGLVHIWDVQTGEMVIGPLDGYIKEVSALDFSPDGVFLAVVSEDGTLGIWDIRNERVVHGPLGVDYTTVRCARFSPDNSLIASGSADRTVTLWDVKSGLPAMKALQGHSGSVISVDFSPSGSHIVSGSRDSTIRVWDSKTGETTLGPLQLGDFVFSVEFSSDGLRILSGSGGGVVQVWDTQTGRELLVYDFGASHMLREVAFSPDGLLIVSASFMSIISILDAKIGETLLGPLERHTYSVTGVQFSPDGSHVVSCSIDRTIRFWDVSICRYLTDDAIHKGWDDSIFDLMADYTFAPRTWVLNKDGWVFDPEERPMVWVPADLRACLLLPPNDLIISDHGSFKLNFDEANIGEGWSGCYRP